jgi:hypothetical protein
MAKKVVELRPRSASKPKPVIKESARKTIQIGTIRYALEITCKLTAVGPAPATPIKPTVGGLVETKFIRVRRPVALGDRIDGWRVCWIGGWDKGKVFFAAMVSRLR